jgi:hypothetical protein
MNQKNRLKSVLLIFLTVLLFGIIGYFTLSDDSVVPVQTFPNIENPVQSPTSSTPVSPMPIPASDKLSNKTKCTDHSIVKLNSDQDFTYTYNNDDELKIIAESKFEGVLMEYMKLPPDISTIVMRDLTYNLDGKAVYTSNDDLSRYVGKRVILTGKNYKFELEGTQRDEIWPVSIVCE